MGRSIFISHCYVVSNGKLLLGLGARLMGGWPERWIRSAVGRWGSDCSFAVIWGLTSVAMVPFGPEAPGSAARQRVAHEGSEIFPGFACPATRRRGGPGREQPFVVGKGVAISGWLDGSAGDGGPAFGPFASGKAG